MTPIRRLAPAAAASLIAASAFAGGVPEIIGGKPAPDGRYPWMVPLLKADIADNFEAQGCGGSLIGPKHVLTAAHCAGPEFDVLIGSQDLQSGQGRRVRVVKFTSHPKFSRKTLDYDIAVLELAEAVTEVAPVRFISTVEEEPQFMPDGKKLTVMGYGNTKQRRIAFSPILRELKVPVINRELCNAAPMYPGQIGAVEFCAGLLAGGKDSCQGDSGGPLISRGKNVQGDVQVGVVSWGDGCGKPDKPGVYARLATLGPWVKAQMGVN